METIRGASALVLLLGLASPARYASAAPVETAADRDAAAGRQWKQKLGLDREQESKFLAALKAKDAELQPLREELRGDMHRVQSQVSENATEKDVQETLQRLIQLHREIAFRNEQFDSGMASFLSPTQRAKLLVWTSLNACRGPSADDPSADGLQEAPSGEEVAPE